MNEEKELVEVEKNIIIELRQINRMDITNE